MMKTSSLYIHIPFCQDICAYCDFCKVFYQEQLADKYLTVLKQELESLKITHPLKTIYIGGGTPSALTLQQLQFLIDMIAPYVNEDQEVCIEVNPESMNADKLAILKKGGINRLSIGVESFNDEILKQINRHHHSQQVFDLIDLAHNYQINNISIDLMYGLPNQKLHDVANDLNIAVNLDIQHISYYALILEDHTVLKNQNYHILDEDHEMQINQLIDHKLAQAGFEKYEISNYAKKGYESKHNLVYWKYDNYFGIGIGASGKIDDCLYEHNRNLTAYLHGDDTISKIINTKEDVMFNHLMMSLRLVRGLDIDDFYHRYHLSVFEVFKEALKKHLSLKTLIIDDHYLRCSKESLYLLNEILIDFLS